MNSLFCYKSNIFFLDLLENSRIEYGERIRSLQKAWELVGQNLKTHGMMLQCMYIHVDLTFCNFCLNKVYYLLNISTLSLQSHMMYPWNISFLLNLGLVPALLLSWTFSLALTMTSFTSAKPLLLIVRGNTYIHFTGAVIANT